jgi:drug/metabolite transporter (DMT)-like permease
LAGLLWMLLATALFSLMTLCVRVAARHVPWSEVAAARAGVGALVTLGVARAYGSSLRVRNHRAIWGRSVFGTLANGCTFFALSAPAIAVGDVATIRGTAPILIAALSALLLKEHGGRRVYFAVPLAFAGVLVLVQPQFEVSGHLALVALAGALFSALAMLLIRYAGPAESPEAIAFHFSATAAVVMTAISVPGFVLPDLEGAFWLTAAGVLGGVAQLAVTRAFSIEKAARVGALTYFGIVLTQWLGVLVLGEPIAAHQVLGSTLVVLAGLVLTAAAVRDAHLRAATAR